MPRRTLALVCFVLFATSFRVPAQSPGLSVDEASTRATLGEGYIALALAVRNAATSTTAARVKAEVVEPDNTIVAAAHSEASIAPGSHAVELRLANPLRKTQFDAADTVRLRMRYRVEPEYAPASEGVVALSEIVRDAFVLALVAPDSAAPGTRVPVRAFARSPSGDRPVEDVALVASVKEGGAPARSLVGRTDARGAATFEVVTPSADDSSTVKVEVRGRRGGFAAEASIEIDENEARGTLLVGTDKPIYQPGQTLHARCLAYDENRRARVDTELTVEIRDPEGERVFDGDARTDRFGVAAFDWPIPPSLKLGTFFVQVQSDSQAFGGAAVEISRYELPAFTVSAEPDRPYYLPGEDASVVVHADYLFGRPVPRGHVRVVREANREWDYELQKWDVEEQQSIEGEADENGHFTASVALGDAHTQLAGENYLRFRDVNLVAEVTDPTTNRTERRRFDVRVTKDAIHLYAIPPSEVDPGARADVFVAASYADGTPARCRVRAHVSAPGGSRLGTPAVTEVATGRTSRFGVVRLRGIPFERDGGQGDTSTVVFEAVDAGGRTGRRAESVRLADEPTLSVETDRAVYLPGMPVSVRLASANPTDTAAIVELRRGDSILESKVVRIENGAVRLAFSYRAACRGRLSIAAYRTRSTGGYQSDDAIVADVVYPGDEELNVSVARTRDTYRPGEPVSAEMRIRDAEGRPVEGVLGVAVVDRAVEERARSGGEFGIRGDGLFGGYDDWVGASASLAGLSLDDVARLDPTKPVPADVETAIEAMLRASHRSYWAQVAESASGLPQLAALFGPTCRTAFEAPVRAIRAMPRIPVGADALRTALLVAGVADPTPTDPWGTPTRYVVSIVNRTMSATLRSAGPDERWGTRDDFDAVRVDRDYFRPTSDAVSRAFKTYGLRVGRAVANDADGVAAIAQEHVPAEVLVDPWGHRYRPIYQTWQDRCVVFFYSNGADGRPDTDDDLVGGWLSIDLVSPVRDRLAIVLADPARSPEFPRDNTALRRVLLDNAIDFDTLRDPWGTPFRATFGVASVSIPTGTVVRAYGTTDTNRSWGTVGDAIDVTSAGPDATFDTKDDVPVARFTRARSSGPASSVASAQALAPGGSSGGIGGTIVDPLDAVVPGATVTVTNAEGEAKSVVADADGVYRVTGLMPGLYTVRIDASGFKRSVFTDVPVRSSVLTALDATIEPGAVTETVTVTASAEGVQVATETAVTVSREYGRRVGAVTPIATPRVRTYFPETLLWRPALATSNGRARVDFTLADSITTWRMSVFASTVDGRIGRATKDVVAFQPFFAEYDPPPMLTDGDRLELPVLVRNFLDEPQDVDVELGSAPWLSVEGPPRRHVGAGAGATATALFSVSAHGIGAGAQRATATGSSAADALERRVSVRPDGEDRTVSATAFLGSSDTVDLDVPDDALAVTSAELRLYPSLLAHAVDGMEAVLERPHGCGEQTISSTYPSVLVLDAAARGGLTLAPAIETKARAYAEAGVRRLLGYRSPDGGFSYWGRGDSDLALTGYALRFLVDAQRVTAVDDELIDGARDCLLAKQASDGRWSDAGVTAYVAQALARSKRNERVAVAVGRSLDHLRDTPGAADEPYVVAASVLAAEAIGRHEDATRLAARLATIVRDTPEGAFWKPDMYTPFHGWGRAGVYETTSTAVLALHAAGNRALAERGLAWILRNKDRSGIWLTTQATALALDAIVELAPAAASSTPKPSFEIVVDGQPAGSVSSDGTGPVVMDLTSRVGPGLHHVAVRGADRGNTVVATLGATFVAPWEPASKSRDGIARREADRLTFGVSYDRTRATATEPIGCDVEISRAGEGGMLLAEVGLPPGSDVDVASLDRAVQETGWRLNRYDVLPDRVVLYVWPYWNDDQPTRIHFSFRPRYGMSALAAPSTLADYYDPDTRVALAPPRFEITRKQ